MARSLGIKAPCQVVLAPSTPTGPASSVYLVKDSLRERSEEPVIVVNVDQFVHFEIPQTFYQQRCGFLPIYAEFTNKASYVKIEDGRVQRVVEKENISNLASAGVYGFSSGDLMFKALENQFAEGETVKGEFYVGPVYNWLIADGVPVYPSGVRVKMDLGNPAGIAEFSDFLKAQPKDSFGTDRSTNLTKASA